MTCFEENPAVRRRSSEGARGGAGARAARKAKELVRKGRWTRRACRKLADCRRRTRRRCELFIVEGDSRAARRSRRATGGYQAILPLKGKILNVEKARNRQDADLGRDPHDGDGAGDRDRKENYEADKLRYGKVIIMTDAESTVARTIRTLLAHLLLPPHAELLERGNIFIAQRRCSACARQGD